ncbi:MAG TPA: carboxypeptidase regulatory-like domain-containing protein [Bryobacteraceae bacterium]|nr:carboxypeptidase regulatory-like domain-containing protein [Bryobacteraceae bacterium]
MSRICRSTRILLLTLLAVFVLPAFSQTQAINGSIRGRVIDQAGAPIPAASVRIDNVQTGYTASQETNNDGYYVFPNLPLGGYTVTVSKTGFTTQTNKGIVLDAGTEAVINAQMNVGQTSTSIEVTGGAPVVDPTRTDTGRTITTEEVQNLPLTSRNPYNFILFQPGISGHPNPELGIPRLLNTNGLVDRVNYQLDGTVDTESDRYGLRLFAIADSYVSEVQTVSNSFAPEFGKTAGDIYNVISGSGTNQFHGEVQFIGRPLDLVARPILSGRTTLKPVANDFLANSGGRIIKDKLFFFASYEHVKRSVPSPITITPANAAAIGIPSNLLVNPAAVEHAQWVDFRLDWQITEKHHFFARYNYFRNRYPFNSAAGGLNADSVAADFRDRAHVLGAQLLSTFSPTVLNELRFGWPYRNEAHIADPLTGTGPEISISGIANFGGSTAVGDRFQEKIPNLADNLTLIKGAHTLKFGYGFQQQLDTQVADIYTQYVFPSIAAYQSALSGVNPLAYTTFNASVGQPGAWYHSFFWNFFAQDNWQITPKLLAIYGVRYDKFSGPSGDPNAIFPYSQHFRSPSGDFAPRLGIAWSINPKTVLRVNSGIFYEAPPTNLWYNAIYNDGGSASYTASIAGSAAGAPAFPQAIVNGTLPRSSSNIYTVTPNFKDAYAINSSIQITRQLFRNDALTVGYVNTGGRNLEYLRNINLINPTGYLADGRPVFSSKVSAATRLDPAVNNIALEDIGNNSSYNALIVNYAHRLSAGLTMNASYTWSHSIDNAPEANNYEGTAFIEDPTNRNRDRGNSLINRPDAFTMTAVYGPTFSGIGNRIWRYLANDNQLTASFVAQSGDEQNITANTTLNGDALAGTSVNRPLYVGRDTARGPSIYQLDMRYSRTFFRLWERLAPTFFIEANNLFNHPNITILNTTAIVNSLGVITAQPTFAPVSTTLEGRIVQLGVRADW